MQPKPPTSPAQSRPVEAAKPFMQQEKNKPAEELLRTGNNISALENEKILSKVEDKLSTAVKEMLWEIVPSLAERIIKEEIEKIENEVSKSLK